MQHLSSTYDLLTGSALISYRLSLSENPWSAHHEVFDRVSLVGTGLLELALTAGLAVGSPRVLELTPAAPLMISTASRSRVKIQVQAADAQGHRAFSLHGLDEASGADGWILHAMGVLAGAEERGQEESAVPLLEARAPEGTAQLDISTLYTRLSAQGSDCAPALQGLTGAWRCGETIYAEVALPAGTISGAGEHGIHPALFDAALHVFAAEGFAAAEGGIPFPVSWSDVTLHTHVASELRVRLDLSGSESSEQRSASMLLWNEKGQPVATVGCVTLRRAGGEPVLEHHVEQAPSPAPLHVRESSERPRTAARGPVVSALRHRLSGLPENERLGRLVVLVQENIAEILALPNASSVPADAPLKGLGLDSMMAVELRNRLSVRVGIKLPTTLAFDYPTPEAIAALLLRQVFPELDVIAGTAPTQSRAKDEPIAIVAMSCRTPGEVKDSEAYWTLLAEERDAIGPFPARWDSHALYDPDPETRGKSYAREGGFLYDVDQFDAGFFGIAPREAVSMDPQQRLVLEVVWEALEKAGLQPEALNESSTGVYLGAMRSDYRQSGISLESMDGYAETGQASSVLSGRVSYALGLQGPAMTIDTACSSSLSALHLACAALRQGECDLALAGGVQVMSTPSVFVEFSRLRAVAPDGRCKSFSDGADGAGWSEGCGVLVLKRQSDAERDGDEILALIRGSAVNQDGRSQGLTAPNGPSQQRVIRAALSASGLSPDEIDVVEAHGTGTSLGDPIEAGALAAVFGPTRREDRPLWLGSSKSNLGHTQAAAGVLGVMKMVLALKHEVLPKTLHAEHPSGQIEWEGSGLSLLQQARAWPREASRVRRAGVSSFGISGTNAHVVIEEAPARPAASSAADTAELPLIPLLVSGRDEAALRAQTGRYGEWLSQHPDADFHSVIATAALHRTQFASRAAVSVRDASEVAEALHALAEGRPHAAVSVGSARDRGRVVFVFPGQGSQWPSMGRALLAESAVFAQVIAACETALSPYTDWSLTSVLRGDEDLEACLLERVDVIQPSLFAMNVGLAAVWRSLGVVPSAVVGHSQGEIAAAVVAGILSLEDGARVVALRSQLLRGLSGRGAMAVTELAASVVEERLKAAEWSGLSVAVVNTPGSTVVSGPTEVVERWVGRLGQEGVFCRQVNVDYASHSAEMDPILPELEGLLSDLAPQAGEVAMISTVTGARCEGTSLDGSYWCRNLRQTVRLDLALAELIGSGHGVFVEASAHPVLAMPLSAASGEHGVVVGSLRRDGGGMSELLRNLGALHVHGVGVDWAKAAGAGATAPVASLPTYAFQRQRYWLEAEKASGDAATMGLSDASHPLLGAATPLAESDGFLLTGRLSLSEAGWLGDHAVFGTVLLPGTGLLELGFAAARAVGLTVVSQLTLLSPLVLPAEGGVRLQVQVDGAEAGEAGGRGISIYSRAEDAAEGGSWTLHAQGVLGEVAEQEAAQESGLEVWPPVGGEAIDLSGHYARMQARGYGYGPLFQGLVEAWRVGDAVVGRAVLAEALWPSADEYGLHPALLDSALHVLSFDRIAGADLDGDADAPLLLPFEWSEVSLAAQGARELRIRASVERSGEGEALAHLQLADGHGRVVAHVGGLRLKQASEAQIREASRSEAQHLYRLEWRAVGLNEAGQDKPVSDAPPLVVGGDGALAAALGLDHAESVAAVVARLDAGSAIPSQLVFDHLSDPAEPAGPVLAATHATAERGLAELQGIFGEARLNETPVAWLTRGAVATGPDEGASGLTRAPLWGLVRSARAEHPDRRLQLVDVDVVLADASLLAKLTSTTSEPELALRHGAVLAPRLARTGAGAGTLQAPVAAPDYRVVVTDPGRLDGVSLVAAGELSEPLASGDVRVCVRAAGMNFRDVLITLGQIASPGIGFEFAGVVEAVGADVTSVAVGDRVFGCGRGCFGTRAVTVAEQLARIPAGMSFEAAATIPLAYLTALYALQELGHIRSGDRVLVHAAAGGVGMAAVQLCRHFGAEVYGTASPGKWPVLERMGLDGRHVANSRDLSFETQFRSATKGEGVDVVLNALTGEFVDASLRLLPRGGRFLEMGIADGRDGAAIAAKYRGVSYHAFVLPTDRMPALLTQIMGLFAAGVLEPLPYVAYDIRQMPAALRQMAQGRHVGKQVVQLPRRLEAGGTVLITGGAGELGREVARHLVTEHGVRHLLLTSRRGMAAPGASELVAELQTLGAQTVELVSCDVGDRDAVGAVLSTISPERPLTGVFHLAALLDDGIVPALNVERLERVLRPKLDGAWHLHELTADKDLAAFVLFSSVAALGSPGQANYAAANVFLDALAAERRHRGLAGQSLLWGLWEQRGVGMTAHLGRAELMRMRRQGVQALSLELGLALLDAAQAQPEAMLVPIHLDVGAMQRQLSDDVPALYRGLVRSGLRRASTASSGDTNSLRSRLAALASEGERLAALVELAQEEIAAVLALPGAASVPADQPLKDLGLDSLMAVELRNRLSGRVGAKLPTTLAFDYPTARAMSRLLLEKLELARAPVRQEKRQVVTASASEPIAIVGMSCRTPGGPASPESYWSLLERGGDGVGPLPGRWSRDLLRRLEEITGGLSQQGGFIDGVADFDASFFGIAPREAVEMDPQQRLILEAVWEALERAGIRPEGLSESRTGVYLGSMAGDYGTHSLEAMTMWTATGTTSSVLAGRVSYVLGLEGPAMTVDTACSSSLTALHLACAALRQSECDLALAGGVTVMSTPSTFVALGPDNGMAPDGRCKAFSAGANGAGWSEGCGVLVLKRQSDAERDGDEILALIRGSAVNQDGRSQGLTAPNGPSQQRVIRAALSASGVSPDEIDVVEAHGTGTSLGDPIEAGALAAVFGPTRRADRPLWLGSSKSNLGHTQAAAGVLGVMKMVLALKHEVLPKTLHAEHPSHQIEWDGSGLSLLQEAHAWPREASHVRRAGVSSFGISGTNAHVVIEEAPARTTARNTDTAEASSPLIPLLVSGRDEAALRAQAGRYGEWLSQHPDADFHSVIATAALHRTQFAARAAVSVRDAAETVEALRSLAEGRPHAAVSVGEARGESGKLAFLFTGQGAQRIGMGRALMETCATFRAAFEETCGHFDALLDLPLRSVMFAEEGSEAASKLDETAYAQPALFAVEVALFRQLEQWGIEPDILLGHSIGELAAAHVSGVWSLQDACRVVAARGALMQAQPAGGAMVALEAGEAEVLPLLADGVEIAGLNGPRSTVISGDEAAVLALAAQFKGKGRRTSRLQVSHAFHSQRMEPMLEAFGQVLASVTFGTPRLPIVSNVTGRLATKEELCSAEYWMRQVRSPVRFLDGVHVLEAEGVRASLELGPDGILTGLATGCLSEASPMQVVATQRRGRDGTEALMSALGALHVHGVGVDWAKALGADAKAPVASLPTYAFQRQRYWLEAEKPGGDAATMGLSDASHPLLGAATPLAESDGFLLTGRLSLSEAGWLGDHAVFGTVLLPGTGLLELGFAAARAVGLTEVSQLTLLSPLVLPAEGGVRLQVQVDGAEAGAAGGGRGISIYSRAEDGAEGGSWTLHAQGVLGEAAAEEVAAEDSELEVWPPVGGEPIDLTGHYARLAGRGYGYGPLFQGLVEAWRVGDAIYGRAVLAEALWPSAESYGLHPALLDSALHVLSFDRIAGADLDGGADAPLLLPFEWSEVSLAAQGARELRIRASVERSGEGEALAHLQLADGHGRVVAHVGGLRLKQASEAQIRDAARGEAQHLYRLEWRAVALGESGTQALALPLIVGGDGKLAAALGLDHAESVAAVVARLDAGSAIPSQLVFDHLSDPAEPAGPVLAATHATAERGLAELQGIFGEARLNETPVAWLTRGAVATGPDEGASGLTRAPLWGLVRSARAEHPDRRLQLVDVDVVLADASLLAKLTSTTSEPELALRHGAVLAPRLARTGAGAGTLQAPVAAPDYRVVVTDPGRLDGVSLVAAGELSEPLASGDVRVCVRAAGMNFRDVLITLGQIASPGIGFEFAGVVEAVGADVTSVAVGDRVFGCGRGCFGTRAVTVAEQLARIPAGMSFEAAATIPLAYLTALYALQELGHIRSGDRVLVHAAAGGVGMAAVQLCRHFGAEVYGTASPGKWPVLERMGLDGRHVANSRDLSFETQFRSATKGEGVDVVLNALTGEFVDASLRLLPRGGRFLEMGIADGRDGAAIAAKYRGVSYHAFVLPTDRMPALLTQIMGLFAAGVLEPLPYVAYDIRQMPAALRQMAQGRHVGKQVVQLPRRLEAGGTVLITGGAGELGREVARHLVTEHGVRHLLLTSRRGMAAPGASELVAELQTLGAQTVELVSCDVGDRDAVGAVLSTISPERPLTGVFHLAALLDDGIVPALNVERLERVLRPKLDGAWHLHELTADKDLAAFVLFSSVAALGSPGQANYAAANVFLDALAAERRHRGLAGQSLLWGLWEQRGVGMTAHLGRAELMRMRRQGVQALSLELGLALLDAAQAQPEAMLVPIHLDVGAMQRQLSDDVPALYRGLVRSGLRRASTASSGDTNSLRSRLAALASEGERLAALVELAQEEIAAVLALPGAASVPADQPLKDLGLDSLMAVELRNRLSGRVGAKLPTTLAFDYPTARAMSRLLLEKLELARAPVRQEKRQVVTASASEPIAIVGMSCRTPGGPASPESYWSLLERGGDGVGPLPGRWSRDLLRRLEEITGGLSQQGGFIDGVADFDASFFGIAPREAVEMDPQQRLILEAVWEALERAGIRPEGLSESRTGVYLGSMAGDYGTHSLEAMTMWTATGTTSSVLAGRVSYVLGLEGPAMTVDTACSSSLTALHLACAALRQSECDLALAGGVTVMSTPSTFVALGPDNGMAPDGRCKAFSAGANGAGWSEGCGVLVLKRQSDAERDGDEILALIRGSAVNQDGRSQGLTAPNGPSQQRVIRAALSASGVSPDEIDVVEAHGTGTSLGDPIEAGALAAVFGPTRRADRPLWLGSSKSNLGHTQAAAGVLGVMKMVLALKHEVLPKTLHAEHPSHQIEWDGSGLSLLQQARAWPRDVARPRRAGVSAFGLSGTNAHVVLEEAPAGSAAVSSEVQEAANGAVGAEASSPLIPLLVSGRDEAALRAQAGRYGEWLSQHPDVDFRSVIATAALHRTQFASRAAVSVRDAAEAEEALRALAEGRPHAAVSVGEARGESGKLAFLFTGQGAQRIGMGRALLETCATFRAAFEEVCGHFDELLDLPLRSVMFAEEGSEAASKLDETAYAQPALFAVEVALFRQLEQCGIEPDILLGHSIGELAAAHVSGVWSLKDACRVVAARGALMQAQPAGGAMVALEASEEEVLPLLTDGVEIAGLNGPRSTVISGDEVAVLALSEQFKGKGRRTSRLQVSHAFHSQRMEPMLEAFGKVLASVTFGTPRLPIVSNVTGRLATKDELCSAEYWVRQVRSPVRFLDGVHVLEAEGVRASLELGPDGILTGLAAGCLSEASQMQVVAAQRRGRDGSEALLAALGALHVHGIVVDWNAFGDLAKLPVASLPTYAFQRQRYWLEAEKASGDAATMGLSDASHPLLGAATPLAESDGFLLTGRLSLSEAGWLGDHAVFGTVLLPGTGLLELGFAAARAVGATSVSQLTLLSPLVLPAEGGVRLQVQVDGAEAGGGGRGLSIYSRAEDAAEGASWTLHAQGALGEAVAASQDAAAESALEVWPPVGGESINLTGHYARLAGRGYGYGPSFQGLREAWRVGNAMYGRAVLPEALSESAESYGLHPALLDAALHVLTLAQVEGFGDGSVLLPFEWSEVSLAAQGARELRIRASVERSGEGEALAHLQLADGHGRVVAHVGGLRLKQASEAQIREASRSEAQHLYRLEWRAVGLNEAGQDKPVSDAPPLIVGGDGALAAALGLDHAESVAAVVARLDAGSAIPSQLVFDHLSDPAEPAGPVLAATHATAERGLAELQGIFGEARLNETAVIWLTRGAVATGPDEGAGGLTRAPLWGLVRSARAEHPDRRLQLVDVDVVLADASLLAKLTSTTSEPELALRHGAVLAPRLARTGAGTLQAPASAPDYRVVVTDPGRLDGVSLVAAGELSEPLASGDVRVCVRAAGMNFRDVLITLGQIASPGIGFEFAGVVEAVGTDVTSVAVGDRVFGCGRGCFGTRAVTVAEQLARIPAGMSFEAAATIPLAYLTALYALQELGQVRSEDRVLVHAAAGGVGMAAVQLCRHFGAEVYGTASPGKWPVLERMGLDGRHVANSRDLSFETQFRSATKGEGVDIVLNALTGEFVDASLRLLPRGGRFLEMGITDGRDAAAIAAKYRGVSYHAFVLPTDRMPALLKQLMGLFEQGVLEPLPYVAYDIRQMPAALRQMAQGRHVGKQVVQLPRRLAAGGTVLITGGAGELGSEVARHLVTEHGVRHLLLTSRRGMAALGASELITELEGLGAQTVELVSCDVGDRDAVSKVLRAIAPERPLTGVFHLAALLDDGIVPALNVERLERVLRPKLDGAWHLHELTADKDLAAFVLFSSVAALGSPGQANYAAANVFLDALAAERRHRGLAGQSLLWGLWEQRGVGMTAHLGRAELMRMRRQGVQALSLELGLALLDAAQAQPEAMLVPIHLDVGAMQRQLSDDVPALYRGLVRGGLRRASTASSGDTNSLRSRLAALASEGERQQALVELAQEEIAAVLALPGAASVPADQPLKDLGLDSLMAVELRNRLSGRVGAKLPTTLAFDYPTARAMSRLLLEKLELDNVKSGPSIWGDEQIRRKLRDISIEALRKSGLLERLMVQPNDTSRRASDDELSAHIDDAETDSLLSIASELL